MIDLDHLETLAKAATFDNWVVQSTYGGERLMDEMSDTPFSCILPENGSWPEDTICEVWGTEHDDEANAAYIAAVNPVAILALIAEVRALREDAIPTGVRIESYSIPDAGFDIIRTEQRTGPAKWKVFNGGYCLTKVGEWEWEPMPSSRTDEFIERCRFNSAKEAIDAARREKE